MGDDLCQVRSLLLASYDHQGEKQQELESELLWWLAPPENTLLFGTLCRDGDTERLRTVALVYFHKCLRNHYTTLSIELRDEIRGMMIDIIGAGLPNGLFQSFLDTIELVFKNTAGGWPELTALAADFHESGSLRAALKLMGQVVIHMDDEAITANQDFYLALSAEGLQGDPDLILSAMMLSIGIVHATNELGPVLQHLLIIAELAGRSDSLFDSDSLGRFWRLIHTFCSIEEDLPEEFILAVAPASVRIGSSGHLPAPIRETIIDGCLPVLACLPPELVNQLLRLALEIGAAYIEENSEFSDVVLEHFNAVGLYFKHAEIYPLVSAHIQNAIESDSVFLQAIALLVFRVLLRSFRDSIHKDMDAVFVFVGTALQSDNVLLVCAALEVLTSADDSFQSLAVYWPKFAGDVIQLMLHAGRDVRTRAFCAFAAIAELIDAEVPSFFSSYMAIMKQIQPENRDQYLKLVEYAIRITKDFDDDDADKVIEMLQAVMEGDNAEEKASLFGAAAALIQRDENQLQFVTETVLPVVVACFQEDDKEIIMQCATFVGNFLTIAGHSALEFCEPLVGRLQELCDPAIEDDVRSEVVYSLGRICRMSADRAPDIVTRLRPILKEGLSETSDELFLNTLDTIKRIARHLDSETAATFFAELRKGVEDEVDFQKENLMLLALSKLLKYASAANLPLFLEATSSFFEAVIAGELLNVLLGQQLEDHPEATLILEPICDLAAVFFQHETPIANGLCRFLLRWLGRDSELDANAVINALIEAVLHSSVAAELHAEILGAAVALVGSARDPSLQQSLAYLFNCLVQLDAATVAEVLGLLEQFEGWRQHGAENEFGYQDVIANICSLYLQVAIRADGFPDELVVVALEAFPPSDAPETTPMAKAIVAIAQKTRNPDVMAAVCGAIARLVVLDELKANKAAVPGEVKAQLIAVLKVVCAGNPHVVAQIREAFVRQKSKARKIDEVLQ
jgi:hypothetical protein